jgi:hypothetical protein
MHDGATCPICGNTCLLPQPCDDCVLRSEGESVTWSQTPGELPVTAESKKEEAA